MSFLLTMMSTVFGQEAKAAARKRASIVVVVDDYKSSIITSSSSSIAEENGGEVFSLEREEPPLPLELISLCVLTLAVVMLFLWLARRVDILRLRRTLSKVRVPADLPPREELESIASAMRARWHHYHDTHQSQQRRREVALVASAPKTKCQLGTAACAPPLTAASAAAFDRVCSNNNNSAGTPVNSFSQSHGNVSCITTASTTTTTTTTQCASSRRNSSNSHDGGRAEFVPTAALASAPSSPTSESNSSVGECVICLAPVAENPVELLPCAHTCFCAHCVVELWRYSGRQRRHLRCPLCRQAVQFVCPAFAEREAVAAAARRRRRRFEEKQQQQTTVASLVSSSALDVSPATPTASAVATKQHMCVQDDVTLFWQYTVASASERGMSWSVKCILWLRAVLNLRMLPIVVGIRIALLHITLLAYLLLPAQLVRECHQAQGNITGGGGGDGGGVGSGETALDQGALGALVSAALDGLMIYGDNLLIVIGSVLAAGHIFQKALFRDVMDAL